MLGYQKSQDQESNMKEEYELLLKEKEVSKTRALEDLKEYYETKLQQQAKQLNKFIILQEEIDGHKKEMKASNLENTNKTRVIRNLEKEVIDLKNEIRENIDRIKDKEKLNFDINKRNQDLVKSNFELESKLKGLQDLIKLKDNTINRMNCKIKQMESELEICNKENTDLGLQGNELNRKLTDKDKELQEVHQKVRNAEAAVKRIKLDLHDCVGYIQYPEMFKESIKRLHSKHVQEDVIESAKMEADIHKDFRRQRELLERSVASLRKKLADVAEFHRADKVRILEENAALIQEMNDLRHDLQIARSEIYKLEASKRTPRKKIKAVPKPDMTFPEADADEKLEEKERTKEYIKFNRSIPIVHLEIESEQYQENSSTSRTNKLPTSELWFEPTLASHLPSLKQAARKSPNTPPWAVKHRQLVDKERLQEIMKINSLPTCNLNCKSGSRQSRRHSSTMQPSSKT